mgnify:CR=1 FL=1
MSAGDQAERRSLPGRFGMVALLVALDQWSKYAVFAWLEPDGVPRHVPHRLLGEWLNFWTSCNPGAACGQFHQLPYVLVLGGAVAVGFLSWLLARCAAHPRLPLVAMTLVLAGALGNLVDNLWTGCEVARLVGTPFRGVRDFIDVDFQPLFGIESRFPAFNLADSCITIGACAWILSGFLHRTVPQEDVKPAS